MSAPPSRDQSPGGNAYSRTTSFSPAAELITAVCHGQQGPRSPAAVARRISGRGYERALRYLVRDDDARDGAVAVRPRPPAGGITGPGGLCPRATRRNLAQCPPRRRHAVTSVRGQCTRSPQTHVCAGQAAGEPACRPGSVHPRQTRAGGHPSRAAIAGSLVRSTREHRAGRPQTLAQSPGQAGIPSDLAPGGVYLAATVTRSAGGLLHHQQPRADLRRYHLTPAVLRRVSVKKGLVMRHDGGGCTSRHCPATVLSLTSSDPGNRGQHRRHRLRPIRRRSVKKLERPHNADKQAPRNGLLLFVQRSWPTFVGCPTAAGRAAASGQPEGRAIVDGPSPQRLAAR